MEKQKSRLSNRRDFLTTFLPACSLTCIWGKGLFVKSTSENETGNTFEEKIYDKAYPKTMTYKEFKMEQYKNIVYLARVMVKELGKDATIELLKKECEQRNLYVVKRQFMDAKDKGLSTYIRPYTDPKNWEGLIKLEVVEDTETAFEMKVTECVFAEVFHHYRATDFGYAYICWGDYVHVEGFNPKIKMVRDKTLMQGDACCNHRYVYK